jgi:hypothetical protein
LVEFGERWNFPNYVGAVDGKHVHIACPTKSGFLLFSYKDYFMITFGSS